MIGRLIWNFWLEKAACRWFGDLMCSIITCERQSISFIAVKLIVVSISFSFDRLKLLYKEHHGSLIFILREGHSLLKGKNHVATLGNDMVFVVQLRGILKSFSEIRASRKVWFLTWYSESLKIIYWSAEMNLLICFQLPKEIPEAFNHFIWLFCMRTITHTHTKEPDYWLLLSNMVSWNSICRNSF